MGLRIIVSGADFSANNLGQYEPTLDLTDRVSQFISAADFGLESANMLPFLTKKALNDFDVAVTSANLWDKIYAVYPFVGNMSQQMQLNLKDSGLLAMTNTSRNVNGSFVPTNSEINFAHTYAMQKDFGLIVYNNRPAPALPTSIAALIGNSANTFAWFQYTSVVANKVQFDEKVLYTEGRAFPAGFDLLQANGLLAGFARADAKYVYLDTVSATPQSYNATYLSPAGDYVSTKVLFGKNNNGVNCGQGVSFFAITKGLTDTEYKLFALIIKEFLGNVNGLADPG